MTASTRKPRLICIPHYIGSVRYFEKLTPFLEQKYDVSFLLLPLNRGKYQQEMIRYCTERSLHTLVVPRPTPNFLTRHIPFYEELRQARIYKHEIRRLYASGDIRKIVSINDCGFPLNYVLREAQKKGADTLVLQWAVVAPGQQVGPQYVSSNIFRRLVFRYGKPLYEYCRKILLACVIGSRLDVAKRTIGSGSAKKFGVINGQTRDYVAGRGVPLRKITVVGYLDFFLAEKMSKDLAKDAGPREKLARIHGFDMHKKNIIVFSSPYNTKDVTFLSDEEQYRYVESIFTGLWSVLPKDQYDFHLKIHPAEDKNLYRHLASRGVKIYGKETNNFEIIGISDLYIADSTTTNFIPIIMNKDSIFVNFLKLEMVDMAKESYGIHAFVHTLHEFEKLVIDWREGRLEKQYTQDEYIYTKNSLEKIMAWIN